MHARSVMLAWLGIALAAGTARAQLREDEVLVIYDSRIADSRAVAEYYVGSFKVPGGAGGLVGVHRGVRVLDMAATGAGATGPGTISYADYLTRLRDPIRAYLSANGLERRVRCFMLTKGLPHRVDDTDNPGMGDNPGALVDEYTASDVTCASVDTELMLLWQNLETGEAGGAADSKSDGLIVNPYWKSGAGIFSFPTTNILTAKLFSAATPGPTWNLAGTGATRLTAGDIYLVSRVDGNTVADCRAVIDRGRATYYDLGSCVVILDESDSNGVADASPNNEFDNINSGFPACWDSDDFEKTRDELALDTRFPAAFTRYTALAGGAEFFVGPHVTWQAGNGILVTNPVALLSTYGSNHNGV